MYNSKEVLEIVSRGLSELHIDRQPDGLYDPIRYVLEIGGKRLRPVLMLMAYNLYRDDVEHIVIPALGLETYHNYTLLHDDLMDRADVRRGVPTVHRKWNDNTAILSGDAMMLLAYERIAQCDPECLPAMLQLFTTTALEICEGQQYDMEFETRNDVKEEEYLEMIRLKTSVLLACALKMGAIQAGAPVSDADALYRFGEKVGLAFQLQDDYLDVYGDFATFGKKIGGDILCNKKTYMLINALQMGTPEQRAELERWIGATQFDPQEKIAAVTHLYDVIGIRQLCDAKISAYFDEAKLCLQEVKVAEEKKSALWDFAMQLLKRNK